LLVKRKNVDKMKFGKTGKINFTEVITASVAGMGYTVVTNALSNSKTIGPKWNANKDQNYALGATALGAGLMYFMPKAKWTKAAGLGLIGAGGAVGAQVITGAIKPGGTVNGFFGDALRKAAKFTPAGIAVEGADKLKQLLNRNAACNCDNGQRAISQAASGPLPMGRGKYSYSRPRLNGVGPGSYADLSAADVLGYN
jgi:hypothetical protein